MSGSGFEGSWPQVRRIRVLVGVVIVASGVIGWMAAAAGAFAFRSAPGSPYPELGLPISVAVGNFTGDGLSDFVVDGVAPLGLPSNGAMWLADGGGGFRAVTQQIGLGGGSVAVGDVNRDGKLDLVAATDNPQSGVTVLLGDGDGTFTSAPDSPIALDSAPIQVVVGDFNGDGKPDLAALLSNDTVAVLLGNGDGTFAAAPGSPISLGTGTPSAIAAADLNGDGKLDLAVTNETAGTVSLLLGSGTGTFTPAPGSPIIVGGAPSQLSASDVNGDGRPDLVVENAPASGLTVLLGRVDGTFTLAPGSPIGLSGQTLSGLAVTDFNDDGRPDVVIGADSPSQGNRLDLLLGDGGGGFRPAHGSPFPEGEGSTVLASGRFDGRAGVILDTGPGGLSLLLAPLASDPPTATLAVSPRHVTGGQRITLNASGSSDPLDRKITKYRWDLGTGRFSHNTGSHPTITATVRRTGVIRLRVRVTNAAGKTAIATIKISVRPPSRSAVVAGNVRVCGGPAAGGCAERAIRLCAHATECVISDRVAAVAAGRTVTVQKLNHGRFRVRLTPGRYTFKLLGDDKHVRGRVLQRRKVTARAHHTATVRFFFAQP